MVKCCVTYCKHNNHGDCEKSEIYISDAETGEPICQDEEDEEDDEYDEY